MRYGDPLDMMECAWRPSYEIVKLGNLIASICLFGQVHF